MAYILMIDDNPQNRRYIEKMIHYRSNHEIGFATNASEAIESMVERRPEVILLDLFIPGMDGFELFENLRKHPATESIPVVVHSAVPLDPVTKLRMKRMRTEGFFQFPIDASALKEKLRIALQRNDVLTKKWVPPSV
jgi:CheY-like chemotaxis protein